MSEPAFDTDAASARLMAVGQAVVDDANYRGDWSGAVLVAELDGRESLFGFKYMADGKWKAEIPSDPDEVMDRIIALRRAMADRDEGRAWKACRIAITRPEMSFKTEFEYDDGNRWHVTPANLDERVEELRPR